MKAFQRAHAGHRQQTNGDLLALWRLDDTGTTATDEGGLYDLALVNSPGAAAGLFATNTTTGARTFNGTNTYGYDTPTGTDKSDLEDALAEEYTVEAWFKADTTASTRTILCYGGSNAGDATHNRHFALAVSGGEIQWAWDRGTGSATTGTTTGSLVTADKTYHVAMIVADAASGTSGLRDVTIDLWCLDDGAHFTETFTDESEAQGGSNAAVRWGLGYDTRGNKFFDGTIDDIRVTSTALTLEAVRFSFLEGAASWSEENLVGLDEYQCLARVKVEDADGNMRDLSSLFGYDFLAGVEWGNGNDRDAADATLTLARDVYNYSLAYLHENSPLNLDSGGSYSPLLQLKRTVLIEVATIPSGMTPQDWHFVPDFEGVIEDVEWGSEQITVHCRDFAQDLEQTFIKDEEKLSGPLVDVVTDIIVNNTPTGGYKNGPHEVYEPVDSAWTLVEYTQARMPVLDAITDKADQRGAALRYKWDSDRVRARLTLSTPERTSPTVDHTFTDADYLPKTSIATKLADIYTEIEVEYEDSTTTDSDGNKTRASYTASSTGDFGERWGGVSNAWNINNATEAQVLAERWLADLGQKITDTTEHRFFRCVELGDYYTFEADGTRFTTDQSIAVVGYRHRAGADGKMHTVLELRGKPSTRFRRMLNRITRPGVASDLPPGGPDTPTLNNGFAAVRSAEIYLDAPAGAGKEAWDYAEIHSSSGPTFTPSESTLDSIVRGNRVTILDLDPDDTRYYKAKFRDRYRKASSALTIGGITPRWMNSDPTFRAYASAAQSVTSTNKQVEFTTENWDVGGWYASNTYSPTMNTDAYFTFSARVVVDATNRNLTDFIYLELRKNGTVVATGEPGANDTAFDSGSTAKRHTLTLSGDVEITSGDDITVYIMFDHSKFGNLTTVTGTDETWFTGRMVSQK